MLPFAFNCTDTVYNSSFVSELSVAALDDSAVLALVSLVAELVLVLSVSLALGATPGFCANIRARILMLIPLRSGAAPGFV
jgi:hypothetical protein